MGRTHGGSGGGVELPIALTGASKGVSCKPTIPEMSDFSGSNRTRALLRPCGRRGLSLRFGRLSHACENCACWGGFRISRVVDFRASVAARMSAVGSPQIVFITRAHAVTSTCNQPSRFCVASEHISIVERLYYYRIRKLNETSLRILGDARRELMQRLSMSGYPRHPCFLSP
jgi:hypothetical protein